MYILTRPLTLAKPHSPLSKLFSLLFCLCIFLPANGKTAPPPESVEYTEEQAKVLLQRENGVSLTIPDGFKAKSLYPNVNWAVEYSKEGPVLMNFYTFAVKSDDGRCLILLQVGTENPHTSMKHEVFQANGLHLVYPEVPKGQIVIVSGAYPESYDPLNYVEDISGKYPCYADKIYYYQIPAKKQNYLEAYLRKPMLKAIDSYSLKKKDSFKYTFIKEGRSVLNVIMLLPKKETNKDEYEKALFEMLK
ncbi:MAG: hypothetical protein IJ222_09575 [Bacteroidales bacterium]|nr:hypothetical protein [Bacteroidales bacterium]